MTDIYTLLNDANVAFRNGDWSVATALAHEILKCQPNFYYAHFVLGNVAKKVGDNQAMVTAWRAAIDSPGHSGLGAYRFLLEHQFSTMDFNGAWMLSDALKLAQTSVEARWHKPSLLFLAGCLALNISDTTAAEEWFRTAYEAGEAHNPEESEILWPWIVEKIQEADRDGEFPCLTYLRKVAACRRSSISYRNELARLGSNTNVVEIGAMDGVKFDPLREFIAGRNWRAVLVEPTQAMFDRLSANYDGHQNVRCVRAAITDRSGEISLYKFGADTIARVGIDDWAEGVSSISPHQMKWNPDIMETETVPALTFDELMAENPLPTIDVLQIDTEGHDWKILSQIDLCGWNVKVLHVELVWLSPADRLRVFDKLEAAGYAYHFDWSDVTAVPIT